MRHDPYLPPFLNHSAAAKVGELSDVKSFIVQHLVSPRFLARPPCSNILRSNLVRATKTFNAGSTTLNGDLKISLSVYYDPAKESNFNRIEGIFTKRWKKVATQIGDQLLAVACCFVEGKILPVS